MARGTPLGTVRAMLKAELGIDQTANSDVDLELNHLLDDKQQWISGEYDWPFLEHRFSANCPVLNQFNPFPTVDDESQNFLINFDRPMYVDVFYNQKWEPVDYGIGSEEYNIWNSYIKESNDPIQKWMYNDQNNFEVWPLPVTAQIVRFTAKRTPISLLTSGAYDDTKTFDLDDLLVVYFTAAERLTRLKQPDANAKLQLATARMSMIRATYPSRTRKLVFGDEKWQGPVRRVVPLVTVHG